MAQLRTDLPIGDHKPLHARLIPKVVDDSPIDLLQYQRIVIVTDGASRSGAAKTATGLLRYRPQHIAAVLDRSEAGNTAQQVFGTGGDVPIVSSAQQIADADAMFIGIAPAGGKLPESWKPVLTEALENGVDIVSGLHEFLVDDPQLTETATRHGTKLIDVRRNRFKSVASCAEFPASNLRVHTVGHDCAVGKMVVSLEVQRELQNRGRDARFLATGQTGIMIAGRGVPVDCVVADFVSGAVEQLVVSHQQHEFVLVEGQGSLTHPSFSGVTLGLLHGCAPQGLIMCYEAGRRSVHELAHVPLHSLRDLISIYESMANARHPAKVIGVAANCRNLDDQAAEYEVARVQDELGLPACDVFRQGAGKLADAVEQLKLELTR
ncbi:DUF1611 domain-containing protein [Aeoliella mucimassa]|uniref:DUF1611 domain-containing protein n=1 Tax=Aeoliella mucimassa TaxID=2527972 RepID=A0A518AP65_9BACT|nr:DUF1611 domain-containing protein [Aeoliella mucimassa]QDU56516.1 hypothetical protein Pan181_27260 [Aeoliella mucimassa]